MTFKAFLSFALFSLLFAITPLQAADEHDDEPHQQNLTTLSPRMIALNNIATATAGAYQLQQNVVLFGVIAAMPTMQFTVRAPYAGTVQQVLVQQGDTVSRGQLLARVRNATSLKSYDITAPAAGIVTERYLNGGEFINDQPLLQLADHRNVYVELSAFPRDLAKLQLKMPVRVFSLHQSDSADSQLSYIAPQMTDGHIARARAVIDNSSGYWRPGMHVRASVTVASMAVALAVQKSALQRLDGKPVVFVREGNTFSARPVQPGREDAYYVEVLSGLAVGSEYVTDNSFVLKADLLKAGAGHDH
ncbi:MAG TPA: efflux RND transporter periplasmic adaptor subunit [Rheinheimera sp.]|nr:efflux RND transporter periplasmic adaptor subunit [Rheinheimera sp.]